MMSSGQTAYGSISRQDQEPAYGSIEDEVAPIRTPARARVAGFLVLTALAVVGLTAMSAGTARGHADSATDANRDRARLAAVDPEVREVALKVLNMTTFGLRWSIFGFNKARDTMIPLTAGAATNDWEKDFKMFTNALPEADAAVAVYNFEYWVADDDTETEPIMITWAPKGMDRMEYARAGYYLGNMLLALNTDEGRINTEFGDGIDGGDDIGKVKKGAANPPERGGFSGPYRLDAISENYFDFCSTEMGISEKDCSLERGFHNCPFESEEASEWSDDNPCKKDECAGAAFDNPNGEQMAGSIPQACCDYIKVDFCGDFSNAFTPGCHPVTLTAIDKLCEIPEPAEPVTMFTTPAQSEECKQECMQPCTLFEDINDSWRMCEGCNTDLSPDANGQISQCYPGAYKYEMNTCCGIALDDDGVNECGKQEYLFSEACNLMEYYKCAWIPATDCPEERERQTREAAPRGACTTPSSNGMEAPLFGVDATCEDDVPDVDCGGGKYAEADDTSFFTAPVYDEAGDPVVQTCADVLAAAEVLQDAYDAEQAALAAVTTAAPGRI